MEEKITLTLVFIFSVMLSSLFVLPFDQLLGEDPYFHREITDFFVNHNHLPQNNTEEWNEENSYAAYLEFKLKTYPQGFYYILYPFYKVLKFFPVFFSGLISISIYLYLSKYSKEAGIIGGILVISIIYLSISQKKRLYSCHFCFFPYIFFSCKNNESPS